MAVGGTLFISVLGFETTVDPVKVYYSKLKYFKVSENVANRTRGRAATLSRIVGCRAIAERI